MLKKWLFFLILFCISPTALAQTPTNPPNANPSDTKQVSDGKSDEKPKESDFKLISPQKSASFGNLRVPAFWKVTDQKNHMRAVETLHETPVVLDLFLLDKIPPLPAENLSESVAQSIAQSLKDPKFGKKETIHFKGTQTVAYFYPLEGSENGTPRSIGLLFVLQGKKFYTFSLVSPKKRNLPITHKDFLLNVLNSMKN